MNNRVQSMSKMKLAMLVAIVGTVMTSCVLSDPLNYGSPCEGVTSVISPAKGEVICTLDSANSEGKCEEYKKVMADGHCPRDYNECYMPSVLNGEVFCHDGCKENEIVCDGKCVRRNDNDYCGARGKCDSADVDSIDYRGETCEKKQSCKVDENNNYKCTNDVDCGKGTHINPDTSRCEIDTNENCGEMGNACVGDEICSGGVCSESCKTGEDGSVKEVACRLPKEKKAVCVDPMTNPSFCGADDNCEYFKKCDEDKPICHEGTCMDECEAKGETLCKSSEGNIQCFDINTDIYHCGGCSNECNLNVPDNVQVECDHGQCKYQCKDDMTECQSDDSGIPECYNLKEDILHCGKCDNICADSLICANGNCVPATCDTDTVCQANGCKNSNTQCGSHCYDCTSKDNAADGNCDDNGECIITKCMDGYVLHEGKCKKTGPEYCVASGTSASPKDCTKIPGALNPGCNASTGECIVEACNAGYHLYNNSCEKNDNNHCGKHDQKCPGSSKVPNASTYACSVDGKCEVTACMDGYHQEGGSCNKCDAGVLMFIARDTNVIDTSTTLLGGTAIVVHYKQKTSQKDVNGDTRYKINFSFSSSDSLNSLVNNSVTSIPNGWLNSDYINYLTKVKNSVPVWGTTLPAKCAENDGYARVYNTMECSDNTINDCLYNIYCNGNSYGWVSKKDHSSLDTFVHDLSKIPDC